MSEAAWCFQDIDLSEWGVGAMAANPGEQIPEVEEETSRLAVLDLDWSKVGKAADSSAHQQEGHQNPGLTSLGTRIFSI